MQHGHQLAPRREFVAGATIERRFAVRRYVPGDNLLGRGPGVWDMTETEDAQTAHRVTLTYTPADDGTAAELDAESYRSYLRRARGGSVSVGEEWAEFVSTGCGTTQDVTLRVTAVDGGSAVGPNTEFEFKPGDR